MALSELDRLHLSDPTLTARIHQAAQAAGQVSISTDQLRDGRVFKHVEHPLHAAADVLEEVLGDLVWQVRDVAWRLLVERHLLPRVDAEVTLTGGSYNSAWARFVDGLTENRDSLGWHEVTVGASEIAAAFEAAVDLVAEDAPFQRLPSRTGRPSTLVSGLAGLVGRRVDILLAVRPDESVRGKVLACVEQSFVLEHEEGITVVPFSAVASATTWQCTPDEEDALLGG